MRPCPNCETELPAETTGLCPNCGVELPPLPELVGKPETPKKLERLLTRLFFGDVILGIVSPIALVTSVCVGCVGDGGFLHGVAVLMAMGLGCLISGVLWLVLRIWFPVLGRALGWTTLACLAYCVIYLFTN